MLEVIKYIAQWTDVPTTKKLHCLCKNVFIDINIWKLKLQMDYPDKDIHEFWTDYENYVVQTQQFYCLINHTRNQPAQYIYEYSRSLTTLVEICKDKCYFVEIPLTHRYVLLNSDRGMNFRVKYKSNIYSEVTRKIEDVAIILDISQMKIQLIGHSLPTISKSKYFTYHHFDSGY